MTDQTQTFDSAIAGSDRLSSNEGLGVDQSIAAGGTRLTYQSDNNLVLYQNDSPIWATFAGLDQEPRGFVMQGDCNAVVYSGDGAVWASNTAGRHGCTARVIEGDWFICDGNGARVFSARGGGTCGDAPWTGGSGLEVMPRLGGSADGVTQYLIHALQHTEISINNKTVRFWDLIDHSKFKVGLGLNGAGLNSYRVIFNYTPEGRSFVQDAQWFGSIRFHNFSDNTNTKWFGFTQGGPLDPTAAHPGMDHSYKSQFEESGKGLCIQPQWSDSSYVGELDIDFHRQAEVIDHNRIDNSDPLTRSSGGGKDNLAYFHSAWGVPGGLPPFRGPLTVSSRGVYDFGNQRNMPGYQEVVRVLLTRGFGIATGDVAVPR